MPRGPHGISPSTAIAGGDGGGGSGGRAAGGDAERRMGRSDAAGGVPLKVVSFNVLAPAWSSVQYFHKIMAAELEPKFRRQRIAAFLRQVAAGGADVVALQEVQIDEYAHFAEALDAAEFEGKLALHADSYWANWITKDRPFKSNGNALFLRRSVFDRVDLADAPVPRSRASGNHCVYGTARHIRSGQTVHMACVHLDANTSEERDQDLKGVLSLFPPAGAPALVIGDINGDVFDARVAGILGEHGFYSALEDGETTSLMPNIKSGEKSCHPLDYILFRAPLHPDRATDARSPNSGQPDIASGVVDFGVWKQFPPRRGRSGDCLHGDWAASDKDRLYEARRLRKHLQNVGSDHFPIVATLRLPEL